MKLPLNPYSLDSKVFFQCSLIGYKRLRLTHPTVCIRRFFALLFNADATLAFAIIRRPQRSSLTNSSQPRHTPRGTPAYMKPRVSPEEACGENSLVVVRMRTLRQPLKRALQVACQEPQYEHALAQLQLANRTCIRRQCKTFGSELLARLPGNYLNLDSARESG